MGINIKANIEKENSMEKENILGQTVQFMKVTSLKEWEVDMELGNLQRQTLMYMLEHIKMIKNVDLDDTYGQMVVYMREILLKM